MSTAASLITSSFPDAIYRSITDTLDACICVINDAGDIMLTNARWQQFGQENGATAESMTASGNYLDVCDRASGEKSEEAAETATQLRALLNGEVDRLSLEYPCHSPDKQRWFSLIGRRLNWEAEPLFLLEHHDVTNRKLAELEIQRLSLTDPLTQLANRREFDRVLEQAWAQQMRDGARLALILLDIDHFKCLNDRYGHAAGDACLVQVASVLQRHARRAGDLAARYGGEEFALILRGATTSQAEILAEQIRIEISDLRIRTDATAAELSLTASLGVCSLIPSPERSIAALIRSADKALYAGKEGGRNQVVCAPTLRQVKHHFAVRARA